MAPDFDIVMDFVWREFLGHYCCFIGVKSCSPNLRGMEVKSLTKQRSTPVTTLANPDQNLS